MQNPKPNPGTDTAPDTAGNGRRFATVVAVPLAAVFMPTGMALLIVCCVLAAAAVLTGGAS